MATWEMEAERVGEAEREAVIREAAEAVRVRLTVWAAADFLGGLEAR